jgi:pyruvate dehydrogenase E1 component
LLGEGLQHADGHSPLLASTNPACVVYDPAFAYELAVILEDAVRRILGPNPEDRFWYITLYNENYLMPPLPGTETSTTKTSTNEESSTGGASTDRQDEVRRGILAGAYRYAVPSDTGPTAPNGRRRQQRGTRESSSNETRASLLFSGTSWRAVSDARDLLAADWSVSTDSWSVTSYTELRREALSVERWNRLHPGEPARKPYITQALGDSGGPVVAVTDYMRAVPDQVSRFVERRFVSLGTDGFGRSDTREALRNYFEVDAAHIVLAVLAALAESGDGKADDVADAISRYGLATDGPDPWTL